MHDIIVHANAMQQTLGTKQSPNSIKSIAGSGCHGDGGDGGMWLKVDGANKRARPWAAMWICAAPGYSRHVQQDCWLFQNMRTCVLPYFINIHSYRVHTAHFIVDSDSSNGREYMLDITDLQVCT